MDSDVPEYDAVPWVTVHLKHQEPLNEQEVTFLKTWILSNMAVRTSVLHILSTISSDYSHCHTLHTNIYTYMLTHTHTNINTHTHTHTHIHTHIYYMDPSSVEWCHEYECVLKQYQNVIYNLVLVMNIHKHHKV